MTIRINIAKDKSEVLKTFQIREEVFIVEQKVAREIEMDEYDESATHIIAYYNDEPAGCARLRFLGTKAKLERIAVLPQFRKRGIGRKIVEFLLTLAREKGASEAVMHAQTAANDFYWKCGFTPRGEKFFEANIEHVEMFKKLPLKKLSARCFEG